tara:strand:- start:420 stop:986 length:567 start_codon:yes stop_codon:yes gene_type:complete
MEIKPYSDNAKRHSDKQIEQIADSIREFGWQQPIVVDEDGFIIVGHGRWLAYKKYDLPEPPIQTAKLSGDQVKAYRLADNKLNESDWDMELVIQELKSMNIEMVSLTGFDVDLVEGMENAAQINELSRERDIDLGEYDVLTVEAPEAPRLKARVSFYTRNAEEFEKLKKFFDVKGGSLNVDKLLSLVE